MANEDLRGRLIAALEAEAPAHDADIVDVEVTGSNRAPVITVRVDRADEDAPRITLDEVAAHSAWVGELLDALDPVEGPYTLEVSSPGMERPLRRPRDFERFAGERVRLRTNAAEGRRSYTGTLLGFEDGTVRIECDGETFAVKLADVKTCTIKPDYAGI